MVDSTSNILIFDRKLKEERDYWIKKLSRITLTSSLRLDHARPDYYVAGYETVDLNIEGQLFSELKRLTSGGPFLCHTILMATLNICLHKYMGNTTIIVGSAAIREDDSARPPNALCIVSEVDNKLSFREFLLQTRETLLEAYAMQHYPFDRLVRDLHLENVSDKCPLFDVALVSEDLQGGLPDVRNDITFKFSSQPDGIAGLIQYRPALFQPSTIQSFANYFLNALEACLDNKNILIADLQPLGDDERRLVIREWNDTKVEFPQDRCAHEMFEAQAEQRPEAVAVSFNGQELTYGELNRRANQLARYLNKHGVGPNVRVAVCLERSARMIIGILGALKAGGAYVPLDPDYLNERLAFMLQNAQAPVLLTEQRLRDRLEGYTETVICLDSDWPIISQESEEHLLVPVTPDNLAYVIYTSGSTGRPKGVETRHRGLLNLINWHRRVYEVTPDDRATQVAAPAFDAAVWELWPYLATGASILIPDEDTRAEPYLLINWIADQGVTLCFLPTPLAEAMLEEQLPGNLALRALLTGGDKLHRYPGEALPFDLVNHYGPTESTVVTTWTRVESGTGADYAPPIGRPIDNTEVYLLDPNLKPVPIGMPGELYVGGVGLAQGYLNQPALTAEKFIPNAFSGEPGSRLYRTGDLARYLSDGNIEFLGRVDHQVKIRGFRIELGEIESVMSRHPSVREAVVVAREDQRDKALVAYVVQNTRYSSEESAEAEHEEQINHWQLLYEDTYKQKPADQDPTFNIVGWNSSYSGEPLPAEEMSEWVNNTVNEIMALRPDRVLEIGCGTGLLLFRIAPYVTRYRGVDFSQEAIDFIRREVARPGMNLPDVTLFRRMADDFEGVEAEDFDTVILNSVIQYFPSIDYLTAVLEGAVNAVKPGGVVFVGDVRSLPLLEAFHASIHLHHAPDWSTRSELNELIQRQMSHEEELVIDPAYFLALREYLPKISYVEIYPKRGQYSNELTNYRYQVIIHVGPESAPPAELRWVDWCEAGLTQSALYELLDKTEPDVLAIKGVPHAGVLKDVKLVELLSDAEGPGTLKDLRHELDAVSGEAGVSPGYFWSMVDDLPYQVDLSWASSGRDGSFDVVLRRRNTEMENFKGPLFPQTAGSRSLKDYANNPLRDKIARKLVPQLRDFMQERLPDYMVPVEFVLLDSMPLTPNGKIDRNALPAPAKDRLAVKTEYAPPRTEMEQVIAEVWRDALGLEKVGIRDNFFDLGGHSLLMVQVHSKLRNRFKRDLSMIEMFEYSTIESLAGYLSGSAGGRNAEQEEQESVKPEPAPSAGIKRATARKAVAGHSDIAIVGLACRFPGAKNAEQFWENLRDGVESISFFSDEQLESSGVDPALLNNPNYVKANTVLDGAEYFDAAFFGYSARDAEVIDPQHRIFLESAWEALESAGYDPETYEGAIGVYGGLSYNMYLLNNLLSNPRLLESIGGLQAIIGNGNDQLTTRVSYKLNLKGPSVNVQSGCSTSLVAVHFACQSLLRRECDMALAGGVSTHGSRAAGYLYREGGVVSPDGHCRAFDARAKGCVPGKGVGVVVLKRLEDAVADGDTVMAVIKGSAINNDGSAKVGYTAPSAEGQAEVIREAIAIAGVDPETISYVETHGTATPLGDPIEIAGLTKAYRTYTNAKGYCAVGSVKTNIGHADAAAGVAGLIKTVLALKNKILPPSLNYVKPNAAIDFDNSPFYVNSARVAWESKGGPLRAGVSSFGIGGTNAHVILEEAPISEHAGRPKPWQLLTISAMTTSALNDATANLVEHLKRHSEADIADIARTLQAGRRSFPMRRAIVCHDIDGAISTFESGDPDRIISAVAGSRNRPILFMFPGQGAQYPNMALELFNHEPAFRSQVEACSEIIRPHLGVDLPGVLRSQDQEAAGQELSRTLIAQPALFIIEYALAKIWMGWGVMPGAMIGHSIGEYVAACLSGVMALDDALKLVAKRAQLMQQLPAGAMLSVSLSESDVQAMIEPGLSIASANSSRLCVVSGPVAEVEAFQQRLSAQNIKSQRLNTSHAFHSQMTEPIIPQFTECLEQIELRAPEIPFVSNVTGDWITAAEATDPHYWARHLRQTVRLEKGLGKLMKENDSILLEVGPGQTMSTFARQHQSRSNGHLILSSLPRHGHAESEFAFLMSTLGRLWASGVAVRWSAFDPGEGCRRIPMPTYPFERKRYWVEPRTRLVQAARPETQPANGSNTGASLYTPLWKEAILSPAKRTGCAQATFLMFNNSPGLGAQMAARLEQQGANVFIVEAGARFDRTHDRSFVINPLRPADHEMLLEAMPDAPDTILYLWSLADDGDENHNAFQSLTLLKRALAKRHATKKVTALVISNDMQVVTGEEDVRPQNTTVLAHCMANSDFGARCRNIDISIMGLSEEYYGTLADRLITEALSDSNDPVVAYRGRKRWVPVFEPVAAGEQPHWHPGGVYLVIACEGSDGPVFARFLSNKASVVLIERAPFDAQVPDLSAPGCNELSDEQLQNLLGRIRSDYGGLDGVIYAAGPNGDEALGSLSSFAAQDRYFKSTADDLAALGRALKGLKLDFCMLQSSLHAVPDDTQMAVQWASALMMDAFAIQQNQSGSSHWISVNVFSNPVAGNGANPAKAHNGQNPEMRPEIIGKIFLAGAADRVVIKPDRVASGESHSASTAVAAAPAEDLMHERPELQDTYVMPGSELERRLATLWGEALGFERVGIRDNFFDLGGHSLLATQLVSQIRETVSVNLSVRDLFESQTVEKLARLIESSNREADETHTIVRVARDTGLPLSFAQQRLWFLDQLEPGSFAYNIPAAVRMTGRLDVVALERTLNEIIRRHEALRTTFGSVDGRPVQVIAPTCNLKLNLIDLRGIQPRQREGEAMRLAALEGRRPFDLTKGPLLRGSLVQLDEDDYVLLINMHHIISDGWSIGVFIREVVAIYEAFAQGKPSALPELPIQYADFAVWQQNWLTGDVLKDQLDYWKGQLKNLTPFELLADRPRPPIQTYSGAKYNFTLSRELTGSLNSISQESEATLFMTLLAALQILLCRYSGQDDVAVGSPIANRNRAETERLIGCFVNTLVLRTDLSDNPGFRKLLRRVRDVALEAYAHQDLPFEQLVETLQPKRDMSHSPLFQVMFILQNAPKAALELPGLRLNSVEPDVSAAKFDLTLAMQERDNGLAGTLEYNTDLYDRDTVKSVIEHFERLLVNIVADQDTPVLSLSLLSEPERRKILIGWNETRSEYDRDRCVHHLVESQAKITPDRIAIVFEGRELSYGELNSRANQLAHYLTEMGAGRDALVGICMERSLEMIVALLGIHKAGCGYLPVDPQYPQDRITFMLEDAAPVLVLTRRSLLANMPDRATGVICVDALGEELALQSTADGDVEVSGDNLAYVIYTSGSTGKPKGVQISHSAVVNFLESMKRQPGLTSDDSLLAVTTLSFDISALEIWLPLTVGGQVILVSQDTASNPAELLETLTRSTASVMQATPITWRLLIESGWSGGGEFKILCGGEALARDLADRLLERGASVWNLYGPTETTIWSAISNVARDENHVCMGRPIANTQLYVLDSKLQPVLIGAPGELSIGGDGVSRGYINQPALTAERFIPNPFSDEPGSRLYRTGDLVRYRPDGNIEFLGRVDDQVKIHGHRIEVREIEAVLSEYPTVASSVVAAVQDEDGDKRLVAYVVSDGIQKAESADLRRFLKSRLPAYMIPSMFVEVDALPLTPNGKVNRKMLPSPDYFKARATTPFVAPRTEVEKELAAIWSDLLDIERVGVNDNFFDLGGHSLLISRLVARLNKRFGVHLPVRRLFQSPTVSELARTIDAPTQPGLPGTDDLPEVDLEEEVVLDPAIRPRGELSFKADPENLFLTGGTGFVGAFLLRELLDKTRADVYCLVRAGGVAEGMKRLRNALRHYSLWDDSLRHRIIPVPGDLAQPLLGMPLEAFHKLAAIIDVIYHDGASVNFIYPYSKLKAPNVLGTQEVLRLACENRLKPVHYVSTLSVFHGAGVELVTEDTRLGVPPKQDNGYVQSKWVAERLLSIGRSRGIPAVVYRLGRITGHSQTGVSNTNDLFFRMVKSCIQLRSAPNMDVATDVTPVDYVSKAIVHLSKQEGALNRNFHLVNADFLPWNIFVDWIRSYGYPLKERPYNEWLRELKQVTDSGADNALAPMIPMFNEWTVGAKDLAEEEEKVQTPFDSRNTVQELVSTGISCSPVSRTLIHMYLSYFARTGLIEQPGNGSPVSEAAREHPNLAVNT